MRKILYLFGAFFVVAQLFYVAALPVRAAISHEPHTIGEIAKVRDIIPHTISIKNVGDAKITVYPIIENITREKGLTPFLSRNEIDRNASLAHWIEFPRSGIELEAGESRTETLRILVPPTATAGDYHALLVLAEQPGLDARAALKTGAPSTHFFIRVEDDQQEKFDLNEVRTPLFALSSVVKVPYVLHNAGDRQSDYVLRLLVFNGNGKVVDDITVNSTDPVAAKEQIADQIEWRPPLFPGAYRLRFMLRYGQEVIEHTSAVIVFSWKFLLAASIGVVAFKLFRRWQGVNRKQSLNRKKDSVIHKKQLKKIK